MAQLFEVRDAEEGGFYARALGHPVFTKAETWEELRANALEATPLQFVTARVHPKVVQLHDIKDGLVPVAGA